MLRNPELLLAQVGLPSPTGMLTRDGLLVTLPVVAAVAGALLLLRRPRPSSPGTPAVRNHETAIRVALVGLFLVHAVVTLVMVIRHVDGGGGIHVRYLFPMLPIAATLAAAGVLRLPGGRRGVWLVLVVCLGVVSTLRLIGLSSWRWESRGATGPVIEGIRNGLAHWGLPGSLVVAGLGLAVAAVATVAVGVYRARRVA
jgi:hypothetical protein